MREGYEILGKYIAPVDERNKDLSITNLLGVSIEKRFIPSIANIVGTDLSNYKIVRTGQFAYGPVTSRNGEKISIALLDGDDCIISSSYSVFQITDISKLDPDYLMLWFKRPEFDRYARYKSHGSVREIFDWDEMCDVELPIPDIGKQKEIVTAYRAITERIELKRKINDNLSATAATLFQQMFLTSSDRELWPVGSFSHFIRSTVGGDWGQEAPTGNYIQEVSCIRGTDIPPLNAGSIASAPTRYILPKNCLTKKIKADDLVVEISGGSPVQATGRIALVPQQVLDYRGDKLICSNFCRVVTVDSIYLQYFLQYWLYLYRAGRMFDYENSSTGLKNFDFSSFVEKEPIPLPPEELVQSYNKAVSPLYRQLFANGFEIEALQETQQHILPQIMLHGF